MTGVGGSSAWAGVELTEENDHEVIQLVLSTGTLPSIDVAGATGDYYLPIAF